MKCPKSRKPRKQGVDKRTGLPRGFVLVAVNGRQILFKQDRWCPVEFLGSLPIWGEPLRGVELFRYLFPGSSYAMKRPTVSAAAPSLYAAPVDDLKPDFARLADQLALTAWEGEPIGSRQTGSLLIFPDASVWKMMLKDKNTSKCLWIAAESLLDLFGVMDEALGSPSAIWRDDRHAGHETARRNKPGKPT